MNVDLYVLFWVVAIGGTITALWIPEFLPEKMVVPEPKDGYSIRKTVEPDGHDRWRWEVRFYLKDDPSFFSSSGTCRSWAKSEEKASEVMERSRKEYTELQYLQMRKASLRKIDNLPL